MMAKRVLIVDDEPSMRFLERVMLEAAGHDVEEASGGRDALLRAEHDGFNAIVLDFRMPDLTGLEVARELRSRGDLTPVVLYSGYLDPRVAVEAGELGCDLLDKSDTDGLVDWITECVPA
jgi:CheY-like chemotaxis protein